MKREVSEFESLSSGGAWIRGQEEPVIQFFPAGEFGVMGGVPVCRLGGSYEWVAMTKGLRKSRQLIRLYKRELRVDKLRRMWAANLADIFYGGDRRAREIFYRNMWFQNGAVGNPIEIRGILFYKMGRNASHEFYAGIKDGKLYQCSIGEDVICDADGNYVRDEYGDLWWGEVMRVSEIPRLEAAYWGHC